MEESDIFDASRVPSVFLFNFSFQMQSIGRRETCV